ncbi:hypothetical protein SynSYN20_00935 [Synechococcus sp. SYN20]|nr:hypothetical protein SynSYN20_00935 [Synechococcus sp. SYN20]
MGSFIPYKEATSQQPLRASTWVVNVTLLEYTPFSSLSGVVIVSGAFQ